MVKRMETAHGGEPRFRTEQEAFVLEAAVREEKWLNGWRPNKSKD
jgi:hypothetical protein